MTRPGFAEAFADMIFHTQDTEASAPHAFYTHALTNNCPKDVALSNLTHRPAYEKAPVAAPVMMPVTAPVNDVKFDSLATSITEGSSSEDSCTDDGSGDEVNSEVLVHDLVVALSEQDSDDGWVDLQRITQVTMDMCAISQHDMSCNMCLEIVEGWVRYGVMRYNNDKTKVRKFRGD
jgi:hypothetical protein